LPQDAGGADVASDSVRQDGGRGRRGLPWGTSVPGRVGTGRRALHHGSRRRLAPGLVRQLRPTPMSRLGLLTGVVGLLTLILCLPGCATLGEAAGPWRGQVLDAETGQPLEGVVVLAVWEKVSPGAMHLARDFHDVDELVTDAEGRFIIPARNLTTIN